MKLQNVIYTSGEPRGTVTIFTIYICKIFYLDIQKMNKVYLYIWPFVFILNVCPSYSAPQRSGFVRGSTLEL